MNQTDVDHKMTLHTRWLLSGGVDGERANFIGELLIDVSFRNKEWAYANFSSARLIECDLSYCSLYGCNLNLATFRSCQLDHANFMGCHAKSFDAYGCDFSFAHNMMYIGPIGSRNDFLYVIRNLDGNYRPYLMFKTGCFYGTEKEFAMASFKAHFLKRPQIWRAYRLAVNLAKTALLKQDFLEKAYYQLDNRFETKPVFTSGN